MNARRTSFDVSGPVHQSHALLAASAGTGKTYSIASIFLRMVIDPGQTRGPDRPEGVQPWEILLVTFTRAATAEMRSGIRNRCRQARRWFQAALEALDRGQEVPTPEDPVLLGFLGTLPSDGNRREGLAEGRRRLDETLARFDEIMIATIHGFCQRMLLRHAIDSGVPMEADVCDEADSWVEEIALDSLRRFLEETPLLLSKAIVEGGANLRKLWIDTASGLVRRPEGRLVDLPVATEDQVQDWVGRFTRWVEGWRRDLQVIPDNLVDEVNRLVASGQIDRGRVRNPENLLRILGTARADLQFQADQGPEALDLDTVLVLLKVLARGIALKQKHGLPSSIRPMVEAMEGHLVTWEELLGHQCLKGTLAAGLRALEHRLAWELPRRKRDESVWTYDDLVHRLRQALEGEAGEVLAREIRQQFRVALIDEFQDTDRNQWAIFRRLFLEGQGDPLRLWLVGDAKQSIYRFRGADIGAFLEAQERIADRLDLSTNWRTDAPLLEGINRLWSYPGRREGDSGTSQPTDSGEGAMLPFLQPEIPAPRVQAHHSHRRVVLPGRSRSRAPLRLVLVTGKRTDAASGPGDRGAAPDRVRGQTVSVPEMRRLVARWTAQDIRATLDAGIRILQETVRQEPETPVQPRHVAVLVRTHREGRLVQRALRSLGIPSVTGGQESVFSTPEAIDLLRLLRSLQRPQDPRSAVTVAALALFQRGARDLETLWGGAPEDSENWNRWTRRIVEWRDAWQQGGIWRLWFEVLSDPELQPLSLIGTWGGERSITNWFHLVEWLQGEATRRRLGTWETIQLLARLIEGADVRAEDPDSRLLRLESDLDAVQIVTIHAAKGLQYPFVWVPFLWASAQRAGKSTGVWIRKAEEAGDLPGLDFSGASPDRPLLLPSPWIPDGEDQEFPAFQVEKLESFQELLRLSYVAMTRPQHEMTVVTGQVNPYWSSPLATVLHGHQVQEDLPSVPLQAFQALQARLKDWYALDQVEEDLAGLVKRWNPPNGGVEVAEMIRVQDLSPVAPWEPPRTSGEDLAPRQFTRSAGTLDRFWFRSSYSTMARGHGDPVSVEEADQQGADLGAGDEVGDPGAEPLLGGTAFPTIASDDAEWLDQEVPLSEVPSGRHIGDFLHRVTERLDFRRDDPDYRREVVEEARGLHGVSCNTAERYAAVLPDLLRTPLVGRDPRCFGPAVSLQDLPWEDTLRELDFQIPVRGGTRAGIGVGSLLGPAMLRRAFAAGGDPEDPVMAAWRPVLDSLDFTSFHGFLKGSIDLVFRHRGPGDPEPRWWVVDYKTNRLSPRGAPERFRDYLPEALLREMVEARYVLQYHLYLVALHRFLTWRLPGYDYDRHVGGACYLFVRGMAGARDPHGTGVFVDRPPRKRIEAISRLMDTLEGPEVDHDR
ncbi:MAG TPA: UvrD-helicase domain-containing protein [Myxococcota bacterium]|nr:UvrD-helicase domain-containing protein [Myxococcota bacterium]HQK51712.1 UvrD-helicase domain-containing protein [Myxococcota bacterium]